MTAVSLLPTFKIKIEEAVTLLPTMLAEERLEAVRFFTMAESMMLQQLQDIIAKTAADLSVLLASNSNQGSSSEESKLENGGRESHSAVDAETRNNDVVMQNIVKVEQMEDNEEEDEEEESSRNSDLVIVANDLKVELVEDSEDLDVDLSEGDGNEGLRVTYGDEDDEWEGTDDKVMQLQQEAVVELYQCIICKKQFRLASTLLAHMASHTEPHDAHSYEGNEAVVTKDYICDKCGRCFQLESSLMHHMERHRNKLRFVPYDKLPATDSSLEQTDYPAKRYEEHESTRKFCCPQCGHSFGMQEQLISHMYKHDVTMSFKYDLSTKTYSSRNVQFNKT